MKNEQIVKALANVKADEIRKASVKAEMIRANREAVIARRNA